jgi:LDH2 family malate/lactate/ureidoglycolate dehydrogenase
VGGINTFGHITLIVTQHIDHVIMAYYAKALLSTNPAGISAPRALQHPEANKSATVVCSHMLQLVHIVAQEPP